MNGGSGNKIIIQAKGGMAASGLGSVFKLTNKDVRVIKHTGGVYEATGVYLKVALVKKNKEQKYIYLMGYDPQAPLARTIGSVKLFSGRELHRGDINKVVLGHDYLLDDKIFSKKIKLNDKITVQDKEMQVIGFLNSAGNPQDDSDVLIVNNAINLLYPKTNNTYSMIVAKVDTDKINWTVNNIDYRLRKSRGLEKGKEDFSVKSFSDIIASYSGAMNVIIGFVVLIALIAVIVSAVNTANAMITSVIERTKEIGIIKSIGGTNKEVLGIFLFEAGFLGFVAGVIGVLLGWGCSYFAGVVLGKMGWGFLSPIFPTYLFGGLILFAVLTGVISGLVPAWNASKINIVEALRYE